MSARPGAPDVQARTPLADGVAPGAGALHIPCMHPDEADDLTECWDCGAVIASEDRMFAFGEQGALCFSCAERRGGSYDAKHDRWARAPQVNDLPDERRSEQQLA